MRVKITPICLIAAAALAAGCGGGSDGGATAKEPSGSTGGATTKGASGATGSTTASAANSNEPIPSGRVRADLLEGLDTGGAPLSRAEFIKEGDEICRRGGTRIETEIQRHKTEYGMGFGNQPNNKQKLEVTTDLVLPVIQAEAEALARLKAPVGDQEKIDAMIKALEKGIAETKAKPSRAGNEAGKNPLDEASRLSRQYGFKACGR